MHTIKTKALSVNVCWQGKRFKTQKYKVYEQELFYLLPKIDVPSGKLKVKIIFGLSSKANDIDNGIKPLLDIFQKKYLFNDKLIYKIEVEKIDVPKGSEYVSFLIEPFDK